MLSCFAPSIAGSWAGRERTQGALSRKDAYEALHPETKHGGVRKSDQVANLATCSDRFTADTAAKTGPTLDVTAGRFLADRHSLPMGAFAPSGLLQYGLREGLTR